MTAGDLCTLADVKAFLSITDTNNDALLGTLITNASKLVNNATNRNLLSASYTESYSGRGGWRQGVDNYPITAVASVTVDGVSIAPASGQIGAGYIYDENMVYLRGYTYTRGIRNVEITYTAGYDAAAIPADLVQATVEIVAVKFKRRLSLEVSGKTLNGETISFVTSDIPASAKGVLKQYTRRFTNA
ncbi:MAG TPA: phage head-tail connector protein [Gammaproteobacteria bacterium]|nr:phage head-tail connector protein [Gammaproteobacteria bacterium]